MRLLVQTQIEKENLTLVLSSLPQVGLKTNESLLLSVKGD